jgi:hypothetical protein
VLTETILWLSAVIMIALWIVTFLLARRRRAASKTIAFYIGTFVVWPAMAILFGLSVVNLLLRALISRSVQAWDTYSALRLL